MPFHSNVFQNTNQAGSCIAAAAGTRKQTCSSILDKTHDIQLQSRGNNSYDYRLQTSPRTHPTAPRAFHFKVICAPRGGGAWCAAEITRLQNDCRQPCFHTPASATPPCLCCTPPPLLQSQGRRDPRHQKVPCTTILQSCCTNSRHRLWCHVRPHDPMAHSVCIVGSHSRQGQPSPLPLLHCPPSAKNAAPRTPTDTPQDTKTTQFAFPFPCVQPARAGCGAIPHPISLPNVCQTPANASPPACLCCTAPIAATNAAAPAFNTEPSPPSRTAGPTQCTTAASAAAAIPATTHAATAAAGAAAAVPVLQPHRVVVSNSC